MIENQKISAQSALEALGISLEEAIETDQDLRRDKNNNKNICICGHPENKHRNVQGQTGCFTTQLKCPCVEPRPVLHAQDIRPFLFKTAGAGALHALVRGITSLAMMNPPKNVTWLVDLKCDMCGESDSVVSVTPVTRHGMPSSVATGIDKFLCHDCRDIQEGVVR